MNKTICLFLSVLLPFAANADSVEIDGLWYNIDTTDKVAEVKKAPGDDLLHGSYSGDIIIPNTIFYDGEEYPVTKIKSDAFSYCHRLTSIIIGDNVTSVGGWAFDNCVNLTSITIPSSVVSFGGRAFKYCINLNSVHIYDLAAWCSRPPENSPISIAKHLYLNGEEIKDLIIPIGVTSIGHGAFAGCDGLTSITFPSSVTSIGWGAFSGCSGLTSLNIGDYVTTIGEFAFYGCDGMISLTIDKSVTTIGGSAFRECSNLRSLTIGKSVTSIGISAFESCPSLESIDVDDNNPIYDSRDNCNAIIMTSNNQLLYGCKNTKIPNSVTCFGYPAFKDCTGLNSITIPNSITSIGGGGFKNCSGLNSITIPSSVTSIGWGAFSGCSGLSYITIPNSVTSIGNYAFSGCNNLKDVYCMAETVSGYGESGGLIIDMETFDVANIILHVPAVSIGSYQAVEPWKNFKKIVPLGVKGDANDDGAIDTKDCDTIVNYILTKESNGFDIWCADINEDGKVDVADVVIITNIIMEK